MSSESVNTCYVTGAYVKPEKKSSRFASWSSTDRGDLTILSAFPADASSASGIAPSQVRLAAHKVSDQFWERMPSQFSRSVWHQCNTNSVREAMRLGSFITISLDAPQGASSSATKSQEVQMAVKLIPFSEYRDRLTRGALVGVAVPDDATGGWTSWNLRRPLTDKLCEFAEHFRSPR